MSSNTIPSFKPPNMIDNLINKVKYSTSSNFQTYLIVAIPIILIMLFLLYKLNYKSRSLSVINSIDYKSKIKMEPLPRCYDIDPKYRFKLCDYYISSSFMTPCIGNQHYDYVSEEMVQKVLESGARYIQIPICESTAAPDAIPVIATAEYGQKVITSLNTLDVKPVLNIIRNAGFKIDKKVINYPLIVHLVLHTINPFTINLLTDNIKEVLGDVLVDPSKYKKKPIYMEQLCNLLDKVILIATPEYNNTKLEPLIIPTGSLLQIYHYEELGAISIPANSAYTNNYNQKLSQKEQQANAAKFREKVPSLDYISKNFDSLGPAIMKDDDIINKLESFNKIGMTIVKPHYPADVLTKNFDPAESIYLGCQLIAMNFQNDDQYMQKYLEVFKDSSFRLKPASMRYTEFEEEQQNLENIIKTVIPVNENVLNDFYLKYGNLLITLESYTLQNTFLTKMESGLRFNVGLDQTRNPKSGQPTFKPNLRQCFIVRKGRVSTGNNTSIYLESATNPGQFITYNAGTFMFNKLGVNKKELQYQAYLPEKSSINDNDIEVGTDLVMLRTVNEESPQYIGFDNKNVKAYSSSGNVEAINNMSMYVRKVDFRIVIKIITLNDDSLKSMSGNLIGVLKNNIPGGTEYIVEAVGQGGNNRNFDLFRNQFTLKNKATNKYMSYDQSTKFIYDKDSQPSINGIFSLNNEGGFYNLVNKNNENLIIFNNNLVKFVPEAEIKSNENLFKLDIKYELV